MKFYIVFLHDFNTISFNILPSFTILTRSTIRILKPSSESMYFNSLHLFLSVQFSLSIIEKVTQVGAGEHHGYSNVDTFLGQKRLDNLLISL